MTKNNIITISTLCFVFGLFLLNPAVSYSDEVHPSSPEVELSYDGDGNASIDGSVIIGFDPRPCEPNIEGFVRYSSAEQDLQFCDGNAWKSWGGKR